jgi:hypothetical protein
MSDICPYYSRIAIGSKPHSDALLTRLRCKQWTCPHCARINKRQWQRRLIEGLKLLGGVWSFWTLTHDLADTDLLKQRKHLSACWNRLLTKLRRHTSQKLAYVRVLEIGIRDTQRMHLHALIRLHIGDARLIVRLDGSEYWTSDTYKPMIVSSGFGYIHDLRNVTTLVADRPVDERAIYVSSYVSKYMSKQDASIKYPKYTRRFSVSQNWPVLNHDEEFESDYEWQVAANLTLADAKRRWDSATHIMDVQREERVSLEEFNKLGVWVDPLITNYGD